MATLNVTSADGKIRVLQVPELDETIKNYDGGFWLVSESPQNFPDPDDPAARNGHHPAGSCVSRPTVQVPLKPEHMGVRRIELRSNIKYVVKAIRDEDYNLHNARHHGSNIPMPHWNFEIVKIIDSGSGHERREEFKVGPPAQSHLPKSEWVEIELIVQGRVVSPINRYYWNKPDE